MGPSGTAAGIAPTGGGTKAIDKPPRPTLLAGAVFAPEPCVGIAEDHHIERGGVPGRKGNREKQAEEQQLQALSKEVESHCLEEVCGVSLLEEDAFHTLTHRSEHFVGDGVELLGECGGR